METEAMENNPVEQHHVDTSRSFSLVKEAVPTFGQRIMLPRKIHTLNSKPVSPIASPNISQIAKPLSPKDELMDVLKKLEAEITETKTEVRMLKERELETEVSLATLDAEQDKNISKMAKAEADAAGKSADAMAKSVSFKETKIKENGDEERGKELVKRKQNEYTHLLKYFELRMIETYYINYGELNIVKEKLIRLYQRLRKEDDTTAESRYYLFP
uniref:Uncharacterized protein n=1 Tax=Brassica oleracea var. oleracea TaxID=109376 RepID=A0A0D3AA03_BRAOL